MRHARFGLKMPFAVHRLEAPRLLLQPLRVLQ
jgi:hypothetical protein